jgi:hypothetical protein
MERKETLDVTQEELDNFLFETADSPMPTFSILSESIKRKRDADYTTVVGELHINYKGARLTFTVFRSIGEGSFGYLSEYRLGNIKYAVKISKNLEDDGNERRAILEIQQQEVKLNKRCGVIKAKIAESDKLSVSVMPCMDGDLFNLLNSNSLPGDRNYTLIIIKIVENVRFQLNSVLSLNEDLKVRKFGYTELRLDNVLYKIKSPSKRKGGISNIQELYSFILGDVGSVFPKTDAKGDYWNTVYYIPYGIREYNRAYKIREECLVESMRYIFGIFVCELLGLVDNFEFTEDDISNERRIELSRQLVKKLIKYKFPNPNSYINLLYDSVYEVSKVYTRRDMY